MAQSYREISPELAQGFRLLMADVDGTLNDGGDALIPEIYQLIRRMEELGLVVGLVSGRTLSRLENMARDLDITGPIIAENGGLAKLRVDEPLLDLGYSRQPGLDALEKLKKLYPGKIKEREDNLERQIDVVMWSLGPELSELREHIGDTQLLDSGYICHLMQAGISKGKTLERLLEKLPEMNLDANNVIAVGDSLTDISLFQHFPNSILIPSPKLSDDAKERLKAAAGFVSDHSIEKGFVEVATHIVNARAGG